MEKKERYEWNSRFDEAIKDNQTGDIVNGVEVLNQQSKRIKELEEELDDVKRDYIPKLEFGLQRANKMGRDTEKENQQLKQQFHELPKKIVEEIKIEMGSIEDILINCGNGKEDALSWFNNILQTILKKYEVNKNE